MLVHEVMMRAFEDNPATVTTLGLRDELSSRLAVKLGQTSGRIPAR